jgi:hypothetical protein
MAKWSVHSLHQGEEKSARPRSGGILRCLGRSVGGLVNGNCLVVSWQFMGDTEGKIWGYTWNKVVKTTINWLFQTFLA